MALQFGNFSLYGTGTGALAIAAITGYISPNLDSLRLIDNAPDAVESKGQTGEVDGLIIPEDTILECTFELRPRGTSETNARKSASLPTKGATIVISNLPVIEVGAFSDALNNSSGSPWFYLGGGQINGAGSDKWSLTLPLKRYKNITSGTAVS